MSGGRATAVALLAWLTLVLPWAMSFRAVDHYMDEVFHIPQTQRYCEGRYLEWDPKITTFPGLYVLGAVQSLLLARLPALSDAPCTATSLRALNVVFGAGTLVLMQRLLRRRMSERKAAVHALALSLYPIHFFYTFLYYTDVGSLFWVLLMHHLATPSPGQRLPSRLRVAGAAMAGCAAVAFRQTNAVWVMFTFGTACLADLEASKDSWGRCLREGKEEMSLTLVRDFALALFSQRWRLLGRLGPLLVPAVLFAGFVAFNGSIVVGDHSNHQAVQHWAQLAYLSLVTSSLWVLAQPLATISPASIASIWACASACCTKPRALALSVSALGCTLYALHKYSLAHPFLLADNRHYTFYVWGRLLGRIPCLKEALAPVYLYAAWVCQQRLRSSQSALWFLIWLVACTLTLVPAHLLEPRYWTTAVLLAHVSAPQETWAGLLRLGIGSLAVNVVTLAVFRYRPFTWPSGEVARFMW